MIDMKSQLKSATDRARWTARGASLLVKVKATKAVWFPPKPVETGKKAGSTAKKATKKATGAAKTIGAAAKKTGAAKKTPGA